MRSLLFVPAHKEYLIEKALKSQADAIIFDLEDSCPGDINKSKGIENISNYTSSKKTIVRISNNEQLAKVENYVDYVMYPKIEGYIPFITKDCILLVETALGIVKLNQIIENNRIIGVAFGNEDYKADTGCENYDYARQTILNYSKAFNKFAIDTVYIDVKDIKGFANDCRTSYKSGFDGRLCLTPDQTEITNAFYTPTISEYEDSKMIIRLYDQAVKKGSGVAIIEGTYVAPPMVKRAEEIIRKCENYS